MILEYMYEPNSCSRATLCDWELIDTISLHQVFGPNADPTWWSLGADVRVAVVGDNGDFVFFRYRTKSSTSIFQAGQWRKCMS